MCALGQPVRRGRSVGGDTPPGRLGRGANVESTMAGDFERDPSAGGAQASHASSRRILEVAENPK